MNDTRLAWSLVVLGAVTFLVGWLAVKQGADAIVAGMEALR